MTNDQIKAIYLAAGFKQNDQGDGRMDLNPYVYDAARALLAGPKFRFERLVEHARWQDSQIAELWARLNTVRLYEQQEVWFWQSWGDNFPESLACPVVIEAHDLRKLIGCAPEARDALYLADLKAAQTDFDARVERITQACKEAVDEARAEARQECADNVSDQERGLHFTYSSEQATNCAGCGQHKHTPLRVDAMGGYVCLTCIDKRLEGLLAEESAREVEKDWWGCQEVADLPAVHEALMAFSHDPTGDNGTHVVKAVIEALGASPAQAGKPGAAKE
ncbi:hypothetical protein [Stutzerimonas nitrititolerans]|uniref:hypothetical protein n=1 Tax=Stutzerimonas nitrititolerans TaxID=2482751 RepID=UPI0028AD259F|nr:hypothetical protein [Stutzerimonas nitrititolerans]